MTRYLDTLRSKKNAEEDGFTLLELMIVVVIIGILAAVAIPIFANQQKSTLEASIKSDVKTAALAVQTAAVTNGGRYESTSLPADFSPSAGNIINVRPATANSHNLVDGGSSVEGLRTNFGYHTMSSVTLSGNQATYHTASHGGPYWNITNPEEFIPAGTTVSVQVQLEYNVDGCLTSYMEQWRPDNTYAGNAGSKQICFEANKPFTAELVSTTTADTRRIAFVNYRTNQPGEAVKWNAPIVVASNNIDQDNVGTSSEYKYCVEGYHESDPTRVFYFSSTTGKVKEGRC